MNQSALKVSRVLFLIVLSWIFLPVEPVYAEAPGPYRLIGTIEGGKGFAGAVLDDSSGVQTFYRLREQLPDGSQIVKVSSDVIAVKRSDGTSYELFLMQAIKPGTAQARPAAASVAVNPTSGPASAGGEPPMRRPPPSGEQRQARVKTPRLNPLDPPIPGMQQGAGNDSQPRARHPGRARRSKTGGGEE